MGVLIRFALPFLLSGMLQMAYSTVDVYFLGRFSTAAAVAGTSQGLQINAVLTSLFLGITNGGTILLGQYTGAKDWKNAARTLGNVILIAAASVIIATVVLVAGHDALLTVMKVPPEAFGEARNYLLVCCCGLSFIMGYNVVSSVLRSLGNSRAPFFFILISTSMNVALDYVCVVRLSWGAFGAALATVISQAASFIIALIYIRSRGLPFAFGFKNISPNKDIILQIMKLGIPMSLQSAVNNFSFMVVGRLINSMGVYASAANSVVGTITGICMMIPLSVSMSVSAITAQNIGAGKADRAVKTLRYGIILCLCFAIPFALICDFFPGDVIRLLNSDAGVVRESILYLYPYSWDCVSVLFLMLFSSHPTVSLNLQLLLFNPLPWCCVWNVARGRPTRYWRLTLLLGAAFFAGSLFQHYAEGLWCLALCLLLQCCIHIKWKH